MKFNGLEGVVDDHPVYHQIYLHTKARDAREVEVQTLKMQLTVFSIFCHYEV